MWAEYSQQSGHRGQKVTRQYLFLATPQPNQQLNFLPYSLVEIPVLWRSGLSRLGPGRDQHTGQNC